MELTDLLRIANVNSEEMMEKYVVIPPTLEIEQHINAQAGQVGRAKVGIGELDLIEEVGGHIAFLADKDRVHATAMQEVAVEEHLEVSDLLPSLFEGRLEVGPLVNEVPLALIKGGQGLDEADANVQLVHDGLELRLVLLHVALGLV